MQSSNNLKYLYVGLYAVAMGLLESAVVVYMRALYYPEGFLFPLKMIEGRIAVTEVLREAATMVMLITVALMAARRGIERFAWFIYAFAVWDIFYYVFLYLLLGWPESLLTWDILFLIPVTWTGPVLAPVINSLTMILLALVLVRNSARDHAFRVKFREWFLLIVGSLVTIFAYIEDYSRFMLRRFTLADLIAVPPQKELMDYALTFIPIHFNWLLFGISEIMFLLAIILICRKK
jgi:hypothetical protein